MYDKPENKKAILSQMIKRKQFRFRGGKLRQLILTLVNNRWQFIFVISFQFYFIRSLKFTLKIELCHLNSLFLIWLRMTEEKINTSGAIQEINILSASLTIARIYKFHWGSGVCFRSNRLSRQGTSQEYSIYCNSQFHVLSS